MLTGIEGGQMRDGVPDWLKATFAADAVMSVAVGGSGWRWVFILPGSSCKLAPAPPPHGQYSPVLGVLRPRRADWRVVGRAVTVQSSTDDNLAVNLSVKAPLPLGSVVVVGDHQRSRTATVRDRMACEFRNRGVAAIITDGLVRDVQELRALGLPIRCRGTTRRAATKFDTGTTGHGAVTGGVPVRDGDLASGDDDAVIWPASEFDPRFRAATVKRAVDDVWMADLIADGARPQAP
jgi:regulator of RNase E activity RraA